MVCVHGLFHVHCGYTKETKKKFNRLLSKSIQFHQVTGLRKQFHFKKRQPRLTRLKSWGDWEEKQWKFIDKKKYSCNRTWRRNELFAEFNFFPAHGKKRKYDFWRESSCRGETKNRMANQRTKKKRSRRPPSKRVKKLLSAVTIW